MSHWHSIRKEALSLRKALAENAGFDAAGLIDPQRLINLAADHFDLLIQPVSDDADVLRGSVAILTEVAVFHRQSLEDGYRQYCIAHEIGHHVLHKSASDCSSEDITEFSLQDEAPTAVQQVEGYGSKEKREREANLFALEFLLPCSVAKEIFFKDSECVSALASSTKLPKSFIFSQLSSALLTPEEPSTREQVKPRKDFELDESQNLAARAESGPLLVTAGPGTGKTQTLVKRVLFLLHEKKIAPERILALTFSNKATQEMVERIEEKAPDHARRMTVMTFHSYALELLRRYWKEAGLKPDSKIIERLDGILYLEQNLDQLGFEYLQNLSDPTANLRSILTNISRAKDELVGPARYLRMAEEELANADSEEEKVKAYKAIEVARAYGFYQGYLEREQLLDFGELLMRAVNLLQTNEGVRNTLRSKYDAILVDEFQDINRASGVLVKEIAGEGKGLWAVGDLRQSIYRWRGASPNNINKFEEDYPGAKRISLGINYRSHRNIVGMFSEFARSMSAVPEPDFPGWQSNSDATAAIKYHVSGTVEEEAERIAEEAKRLVREGIPYRNQAIICRKKAHLNRLSESLAKKGVPILFLGDLFERPEIRDLLSVLDVRSSESGIGLVRVATLSRYSIPLTDVNLILAAANRDGTDFQEFIENGEFPADVSDKGRTGFTKLREDLRPIRRDSSAFSALSEFIFSHGDFLRSILRFEDGVLKSQKLLAIYQFVSFARTSEERFKDRGEQQIAAFLDHVRRLVRFREASGFSEMPASVQEIDAVRLMTVHGSKGLEFDAVFLPYLANGQFPDSQKGDGVPSPKKLSESHKEAKQEEEECLFFVAVSRARKELLLSHSEQYTEIRSSQPSKFLDSLGRHLPPPLRTGEQALLSTPDAERSTEKRLFHISQITRYDDCPREFYYKDVLKLEGKKQYSNPYLAFHKIVYETLALIQRTLKSGQTVTEDLALSMLNELWLLGGMDSKAYSTIYRRNAEDMVCKFVGRLSQTSGEIRPETLVFDFENGSVSITPQHLEVSQEGVLIRRFRTGRGRVLEEGKFETADHDEVLLTLAAESTYKGAEVRIVKTYLASDMDRPVRVTKQAREGKTKSFERTLSAIGQRKFDPKPNVARCPNCPYYFICSK